MFVRCARRAWLSVASERLRACYHVDATLTQITHIRIRRCSARAALVPVCASLCVAFFMSATFSGDIHVWLFFRYVGWERGRMLLLFLENTAPVRRRLRHNGDDDDERPTNICLRVSCKIQICIQFGCPETYSLCAICIVGQMILMKVVEYIHITLGPTA